ncbi:MAG: hypothetical protein KC553_04810 [Nitrospina sp.]|nr:hypothetical protein [Nitrospina sp.]
MRSGLFLILGVLTLASTVSAQNLEYVHIELVNALKDAYPGKGMYVKGNSCSGVEFGERFPEPRPTVEDCERIMAQWPARKAHIQAGHKQLEQQQLQEEQALKAQLGLAEEDIVVLKRMLSREEAGQ